MAYTREGSSYYDPTAMGMVERRSSMDKAYDDLVSAINESNSRNSKPRSKALDTSRMNKVYKPKASPGPIGSPRSIERSTPKPTPRAAERGMPKAKVTPREAERGKAKTAKPKVTPRAAERNMSKPAGKSKNTSFNKSGVAGVLKSPEAKKFRDTFNKKGLIPALRGK